VKAGIAVNNRVRQELLDLRLEKGEIFMQEKVRNQFFKLRLRLKLLKEVLLSGENQLFLLEPGHS
jgi:hypothetical protein